MEWHGVSVYVAQMSITLAVVYVWARVSLAKQDLIPVPWPIVAVLFAVWGIKATPDLLGAITKGIGG